MVLTAIPAAFEFFWYNLPLIAVPNQTCMLNELQENSPTDLFQKFDFDYSLLFSDRYILSGILIDIQNYLSGQKTLNIMRVFCHHI